LLPGCSGKILHLELGVEGKQAVRNIGIQGGDKRGDLTDFPLIHISGNQEGGCYQKRRIGSFWQKFC
jgi:hypothetical protein